MSKKVLLTGYSRYVIDSDVATAIAFISQLVPVEISGYGKERTCVEQEGETAEFELIDEKQFIRSSDVESTIAYHKKLRAAAEERASELDSKNYDLRREVEKLKKEIETLSPENKPEV